MLGIKRKKIVLDKGSPGKSHVGGGDRTFPKRMAFDRLTSKYLLNSFFLFKATDLGDVVLIS